MRLPHADMAFEFGKMVYSKTQWLNRFSFGKDKRPDHELERVRRERAALVQAEADYKAAAQRGGRAA